MLRLLSLAAVVATVAAVPLSILPDNGFKSNNNNDFHDCTTSDSEAQTGVIVIAIEEEGGDFLDHQSILYKCKNSANPFFLRALSVDDSHTVVLNFNWPTVLDENYLFSSPPKNGDKDSTTYGFRVQVASQTKTQFHYRRFMFHSLKDFNGFIGAASSSDGNAPVSYTKMEFFKAPKYNTKVLNSAIPTTNQYGDHYATNQDVLQAFAHKGSVNMPHAVAAYAASEQNDQSDQTEVTYK